MGSQTFKPIILVVTAVSLLGAQSSLFKSRNKIAREPLNQPIHGDYGNGSLPPLLTENPVKTSTLESRSFRNTVDTSLPALQLKEGSLTLPSYLDLIVQDSTNISNGEYDAKIGELQNLMDQSRYDFDITFQTYVRGSQLPTPTEGMGTTLEGRMGIQADKLLYDGNQNYYRKENTTLLDRLGKMKKLSAKEQVKLYGIELYLRLLELQGRKNYMTRYQEIGDKLYQMTMQKYQNGVSDNAYDQINAKIDKIALEKIMLGLQYDLYSATVAFKQAGQISPTEEVTLVWPEIDVPEYSAEDLQKKAIEQSRQVEIADAVFRLKTGDILTEKGKDDWQVNLNGFAGAGYSKTTTNVTTSNSTGGNWLISLKATHPLYNNSIDLGIEKKMVEALREKNNLRLAQQNVVLRVNKLFTDSEREKQMLKLLSVQKELMERHLKISKYRFEGGLDPYIAYAASMKKMIEVEEEILVTKIRQKRNLYELHLLTGDLD